MTSFIGPVAGNSPYPDPLSGLTPPYPSASFVRATAQRYKGLGDTLVAVSGRCAVALASLGSPDWSGPAAAEARVKGEELTTASTKLGAAHHTCATALNDWAAALEDAESRWSGLRSSADAILAREGDAFARWKMSQVTSCSPQPLPDPDRNRVTGTAINLLSDLDRTAVITAQRLAGVVAGEGDASGAGAKGRESAFALTMDKLEQYAYTPAGSVDLFFDKIRSGHRTWDAEARAARTTAQEAYEAAGPSDAAEALAARSLARQAAHASRDALAADAVAEDSPALSRLSVLGKGIGPKALGGLGRFTAADGGAVVLGVAAGVLQGKPAEDITGDVVVNVVAMKAAQAAAGAGVEYLAGAGIIAVPGVGEVALVVGGTILVGEGIRTFMKTDAGKWVGDQLGKGYDEVTGAVGDAGSWVGDEASSAWDWAFG